MANPRGRHAEQAKKNSSYPIACFSSGTSVISDEGEIPVEITEPMAFALIIPSCFSQTRGDFLNRRTKKLLMQKESWERKMKRKNRTY